MELLMIRIRKILIELLRWLAHQYQLDLPWQETPIISWLLSSINRKRRRSKPQHVRWCKAWVSDGSDWVQFELTSLVGDKRWLICRRERRGRCLISYWRALSFGYDGDWYKVCMLSWPIFFGALAVSGKWIYLGIDSIHACHGQILVCHFYAMLFRASTSICQNDGFG